MYLDGIRVRYRILTGKLVGALAILARIFENNAHGCGVTQDRKQVAVLCWFEWRIPY